MPGKLTDAAIKALKPKDKSYKISDGTIGGLFLAVSVAGKKVFRLAYKFGGKAQQLTLCSYPEFSLAEARQRALTAKAQIAQGIDPAAVKREGKARAKIAQTTFRDVAEQWLNMRRPEWSDVHLKDTEQKLNRHILPRFGDKPVAEVDKTDVKAALDTLQAQQKFATLKKVRSIISQVFNYALDIELPGVLTDWTARLHRQYSSPAPKSRAALTTNTQVKGLMQAIESYAGTSLLTSLALRFSALTFCRPGEIRRAEWAEFDFADSVWRIPADKMKMGQMHIVPLARQTLDVLERLRPLSSHSRYLFPSVRSDSRPMSEATITAALRRMGYSKDEMCAHGFRGMASTILNEQGYNPDWIERQLAHCPRNKVRSAYNHAEFLEDRRRMMQDWADYLDIEDKNEQN